MMKTRYPLLAQRLRAFNAKERFHLLSHIIGNENFSPCDAFWSELTAALRIVGPRDYVYGAMDYHLDWLHAALRSPALSRSKTKTLEGTVTGSQEDIDFVLCFSTNDGHHRTEHLVLIEAKGVGTFTAKQLTSKHRRLQAILGEVLRGDDALKVYVVLMSPRLADHTLLAPFKQLVGEDRAVALHLRMPAPREILSVTRCNDALIQDRRGEYWMVRPRR